MKFVSFESYKISKLSLGTVQFGLNYGIANISGQPTPKTFREIDTEIKERVDYIVGYRQDDLGIASPSRIIKLDEQGNIIIIRE